MKCVHLGNKAGSLVKGCCSGSEQMIDLYECHSTKQAADWCVLHGSGQKSLANIQLTGAPRQVASVAVCVNCPYREQAQDPRGIPLVADTTPPSRAKQLWQAIRDKRNSTPGITNVITINVNTHGFGDSVTAAWIAEGSKDSVTRLRLCATGARAELLRMLGQDILNPETGDCKSFHTAGPEYIVNHPVGAPPVAVFRARRLGIKDDPKRPPVSIPQEAVEWAADYKTDVLLFPHCTQGSRTWPHARWVELYKSLVDDGLVVRVAGVPDEKWEWCPDWLGPVSWPRTAALMNQSEVIVGNDSGPMHLSGTLNRPSIALLGRTTDAVFSTYPSVRCLTAERRQVPCAGCWGGWGYNGSVCEQQCAAIASISVPMVMEAIKELMASRYAKSPIGFAVACWGNYWDRFGQSFIGSMEGMTPRPAEVVIVTDQDINCPSWFRVIAPKSEHKMWDWFNEAVEHCTAEWVIVPGIDDVYFANALADVTLEGDAIAIGLMENGVIRASPGKTHWELNVLGPQAKEAWYPMIFKRSTFLRFPWRRAINPDSHQLFEMRKANIDMRFDPRPRFDHRRHAEAHSSQEAIAPLGRSQLATMQHLLAVGEVSPGCEWPPN